MRQTIHPFTQAQTTDRFECLLTIEQSSYNVSDYLGLLTPTPTPTPKSAPAPALVQTVMTHRWRSKIVEWAYQIVDHYSYSRELVEVTLSLLDRYLCTSLATKHTFQLAAMTCLYIALKTHAPNGTSMSVESLLTLGE